MEGLSSFWKIGQILNSHGNHAYRYGNWENKMIGIYYYAFG